MEPHRETSFASSDQKAIEEEVRPSESPNQGQDDGSTTLTSGWPASEKSVEEKKEEENVYEHNLKPYELHLIFAALSVCGFLSALDGNIVGASLPAITSSFHALDQQTWVSTSYLLTSTIFQPLYGRACDLVGPKPLLLVSIFIFEFGSAMVGAAKNFIWLCAARGVAGIGAAGLQVVVLIIVSKMVPLRERGRYTGILFARFALANALGPVLGGIFSQDVTWRWVFYINLPIGGVAALIILPLLKKIPNYKKDNVKVSDIDFLGAALLTTSITSLLLALQWGGVVYSWKSPQVIVLLCVGGAVLIGFIVLEHYFVKEQLIPFKIFKYRNVVTANLNYFFINMATFGISLYVPTYFQVVNHESQILSGLMLLPYVLPLTVTSTIVGQLIARTGLIRPWLWTGGAVHLLGNCLLTMMDGSKGRGAEIVFLLITGAGVGFVYQSNSIMAQSQVSRADLGMVTTVTAWSRYLGGILGLAIQGTIIQNVLSSKIRGNPVSAPYASALRSISNIAAVPPEVQAIVRHAYGLAFQRMFAATAALVALGFIASLFSLKVDLGPRQRKRGHKDGVEEAEMGKISGNDSRPVSQVNNVEVNGEAGAQPDQQRSNS